MISRRGFIRGAAAFTAGLVADQAVEQFMIEPLLQSDRPAPVYTGLSVRQFERNASDHQKAALSFAGLSTPQLRERAPSWATYAERDDTGRWIIQWQGAGLRDHIWPGQNMAGVPMDQQPDPVFGEWAAGRLTQCSLSREPAYQACQAWISTLGRVERYTAMLVPIGQRGMISASALIA